MRFFNFILRKNRGRRRTRKIETKLPASRFCDARLAKVMTRGRSAQMTLDESGQKCTLVAPAEALIFRCGGGGGGGDETGVPRAIKQAR